MENLFEGTIHAHQLKNMEICLLIGSSKCMEHLNRKWGSGRDFLTESAIA